MKKKSVWEQLSKEEYKDVFKIAEDYRKFLSENKTERLSLETFGSAAKKKKLFFYSEKDKIGGIARIKGDPRDGIKWIAAHIDAPRLDLKPNPLYEESALAMLKTHYYGGIKKYQWTAIPLALKGIVLTEKGKRIKVDIGDKPDDPVFTIADLLPHLARKVQNEKKITEAIEGEKLTLLVGNIPLPKIKEEAVKRNILNILKEKYGIAEEDLVSAEIEVVPAGEARYIGFDKSLMGGYGHDDRVCSYTSFRAIIDAKPKSTIAVLFMDKEEIGSVGNTGAQSTFITDFIIQLLEKARIKPTYANIRKVFMNSQAISADVGAGINPNYQDVQDKYNAALMGYGLAITKYTGSGGKSGANDAHAEFMWRIRKIFNENKVIWQVAELGKVDEGGGGTVAKYLSNQGIDTIDIGIPVLGMHSPFEVVSIADVYEGYKGYKAFLSS